MTNDGITIVGLLDGCIELQCNGRNCMKVIAVGAARGNDNRKTVIRAGQVHASSNGLSLSHTPHTHQTHTHTHTHTHTQLQL
jgi:hypothetical protein